MDPIEQWIAALRGKAGQPAPAPDPSAVQGALNQTLIQHTGDDPIRELAAQRAGFSPLQFAMGIAGGPAGNLGVKTAGKALNIPITESGVPPKSPTSSSLYPNAINYLDGKGLPTTERNLSIAINEIKGMRSGKLEGPWPTYDKQQSWQDFSAPQDKAKAMAAEREGLEVNAVNRQSKEWSLPEDLRQQRAQDLGYTTDAVHGTTQPFNGPQVNIEHKMDPFFSTDSADLANMYSHTHPYFQKNYAPGYTPDGAASIPLKLNTSNYHTFDAGGRSWVEVQNDAIRGAQAAGKQGVVMNNVLDEPYSGVDNNYREVMPPQTTYLALDPSTVRSPFAKFDPTRVKENNILAGLGGAGAMIQALKGNQQDQQ